MENFWEDPAENQEELERREKAGTSPNFSGICNIPGETFIKTIKNFHMTIFQANVLSPDPDVMSVDKVYANINNHWKPVYLNCAPCLQRLLILEFYLPYNIIYFPLRNILQF